MHESLREKLDPEKVREKAESLFSKKFMEYLSKKKAMDSTFPEQVFREGRTLSVSPSSDETTASESSRKSGKRFKKKTKERSSFRSLEFDYTVRSKMTQCSLLKEEQEVTPPEEIKPLLINMTILLQELKQSSGSYESLYSLISRITLLVTEFIRRPLKKVQEEKKSEHSKNLRQTTEAIVALLNECKNSPAIDPDNGVRELKRMERETTAKEQQIAEMKKKLSPEERPEQKPRDITQRVRNSIINNEKLKAEIKFNHANIKKYKKQLLEKEWTKHKLENELAHLKKKLSKGEPSEGEATDRRPNTPDSSLRGIVVHKLKTLNHKKVKEKLKVPNKRK